MPRSATRVEEQVVFVFRDPSWVTGGGVQTPSPRAQVPADLDTGLAPADLNMTKLKRSASDEACLVAGRQA